MKKLLAILLVAGCGAAARAADDQGKLDGLPVRRPVCNRINYVCTRQGCP